MKTIITSLAMVFLISLNTFAQQGINYKAIIKDNLGNVVANQNITVQFTILKGAAQTNAYQETHTPTTDANGIIIVTIGQGTTSDDFSTIDWGSDDHFLNVQINTGSGLTDLGTTQFMAVPYALSVKDAPFKKVGNVVRHGEQSDFLFGTPTQNYTAYTNPEKKIFYNAATGAFRGGAVTTNVWDAANLGISSFVYGNDNKVAGDVSAALGQTNDVSGDFSFAQGLSNTLSYNYGAAFGSFNNLSGLFDFASGANNTSTYNYTVLFGKHLITGKEYQTVFGKYNAVSTTTAFQIGNGADDANRNTFFSIEDNGAIRSDFYKGTDERNIVVDANGKLITSTVPIGGTGLEAIDEGNGVGYRLKGRNPAHYGNIGENAVDLSISPSASEVYGASGNYATAMGVQTTASGVFSTALNAATTASGVYSTAMGFSTKAEGLASLAIGSFNIGGGNASNWILTDPLFEIGNGISDSGLSNALTVLKNGKVGIGSNQPTGFLEVKAVNTGGQPNLNLIHEGTTGARINFSNTDTTNGNVWTLYGDTNDVDANSYFNLYHSNTGNIITVKGDGKVNINGDLAVSKTVKIGSAGVAISEVVKITGVTYRAAQGGGVGSNNIPYPAGYNWENTYVVSFKVKSRVGGLGGVNWYTSLGNYNSGDNQSIYIDLGYEPNSANTPYIKLKLSDPQYEGAEYVLILMKID